MSDGNSKTTNQKRRPVDEVRFGRVKVVVWKNKTQDGNDVLNFVPSKLYKDGDEWRETSSLGVGDLLPMTEALREAYRRVSLAENRD